MEFKNDVVSLDIPKSVKFNFSEVSVPNGNKGQV